MELRLHRRFLNVTAFVTLLIAFLSFPAIRGKFPANFLGNYGDYGFGPDFVSTATCLWRKATG